MGTDRPDRACAEKENPGPMSFRTDPRTLRGSIAPLMTPFTPEGEVDHESLANAVKWQLANGTHGLSIGGSTGEPSSQTSEERLDAIKTVLAASGHKVPVIPGTGTARLHETLELTGRPASWASTPP